MRSVVSVPAVAWARLREREAREKSPKRSRSVIVRPTSPDERIRRVTRSTSATSTASSSAGERARLPSADCEPSDRRRRRARTGRGSRLLAIAFRCQPTARPSIAASAGAGHRRQVLDPVDPALVQLGGRGGPDAPQRLDRQRVQEGRLALGRAPPAGRPAWPRGWPPWPGAWCAPPPPSPAGRRPRAPAARRRSAIWLRRSPRSAPARARPGTPPPSTAPPPPARCPEDREHVLAGLDVGLEPRRRPRSRPGTAAGPDGRPWRRERPWPAPRSWRP